MMLINHSFFCDLLGCFVLANSKSDVSLQVALLGEVLSTVLALEWLVLEVLSKMLI